MKDLIFIILLILCVSCGKIKKSELNTNLNLVTSSIDKGLNSIYNTNDQPLIVSQEQEKDSIWHKNLRLKQLKNINDSTLWDTDRMQGDNLPSEYGKPGFMEFGAYPVPIYDSLRIGSFRGVGTKGQLYYPIKIREKKIVYSSFYVNDNTFSVSKSKRDKVFFTIVTVTDTIDLKNFKTAKSQIISRNHPDYLGQGFIKLENNKIDFMAFTTPEGDNYGIINSRLFHLNYGNVIIIAPQKDGTLRSMQLKEKELESEVLDEYIRKDLLKREKIIEFLTNKGVI